MSKVSLNNLLTLILLCGIGVIAFLFVSGKLTFQDNGLENPDETSTGLLKTEGDFRDKLAELRMDRDKMNRGLKQLAELRSDTVERLKASGVSSSEDYFSSDDPDVKYFAISLKNHVAQIEKLEKQVAQYDQAITSVETMLDRIERERIDESVAMSEEQYLELRKVIVDLNERLQVETNVLEDEELAKLLDLEMGKE